ncbi:MAG: DUF1214 domain-containing protein, partial [Candidatus Sulfotelmatobacter sp.]
RLTQLGILRDDPFAANAVNKSLRIILEHAITLGHDQITERESHFEEFCPGWIWEGPLAGKPGRDHLSRAASAKAGLGILAPEEAIYPFAYVDDRNESLSGTRNYRLTVPAEGLRQAKYSWSFTVYKLPQYQLVKNPIDRYSWGNTSAGKRWGGNVELALQSDRPADQTSNWLPTPKSGNFVVAFRMFGPSEAMVQGRHPLPRIMRV